MSHPHQHSDPHAPNRTLSWVFWGFIAVAGFLLLSEHWAHALGWLPFLIILACPLMHMFGHHGHGHGHEHGNADGNAHRHPASQDPSEPPNDERSQPGKGA